MRLALVIPASLLLVGTVLLASCGGGKHDDGSATANGGFFPTPSTDDPFVSIVRQQTDTAAATSENTEPQSVTF
jgi:hypothetical protein